MSLPGALISPLLGGGMGDGISKNQLGSLAFCGSEQRDGRVQNHAPTTRNGKCLPGSGGPGLGLGMWKTGEQRSLRESMACCSARGLEVPAGRVWGEWAGGGGGSQGAREADVTNFSSAPSWPEAAWDFPEWKDRLGIQATWGQGWALRTPSPPQLSTICRGGSGSSGAPG